MSYIYTLENGNFQLGSDGKIITNIIYPLVIKIDGLVIYPYIVTKQEEMRPDLVLRGMYGNSNFIDEILTFNNIIDSFSLTEGTILWYPDEKDLDKLRKSPIRETDQQIINKLVNPNSERIVDSNRQLNLETGQNLTPPAKPTTLKQIEVDTKNNVIKIINRLK